MNMEKQLFDADMMSRMMTRMAYEIIENNDLEQVALVGIQTRGEQLAHRIQRKIQAIKHIELPLEALDITDYRDDVSSNRTGVGPQVPAFTVNLTHKTVIIVDDVLYTGRTVRAAIDAIMDVSRPNAIRLAILVDRGHRELPIRADYVGKNIPTSRKETIQVKLTEIDQVDAIVIQ
ncbi:bifunctional pyr operon transcriptional regulator/uracil phosphoribosyltransferase PyrR [Aerococcaceae bacterium NML171108]|nr:bifunctional pyr operon transcriptional regulator/uracil phosphoribosyltransferase PyrR [Aerococcaceae bacterium NML171108]